MSERLLRAIRLRKACWRLLDGDNIAALCKTVCLAERACAELNGEEMDAYMEFLRSDPVAAAILERARGAVSH